MSFWAAASFQYVNPKVWVMGIGLIACFLPNDGTLWLDALLAQLSPRPNLFVVARFARDLKCQG